MDKKTPLDCAVITFTKCLGRLEQFPTDGIALVGLVKTVEILNTELRRNHSSINGQGPQLVSLLPRVIDVLSKDILMSKTTVSAKNALQMLETVG